MQYASKEKEYFLKVKEAEKAKAELAALQKKEADFLESSKDARSVGVNPEHFFNFVES